MFGYIDKNGTVNVTPLSAIFHHKQNTVQESGASPVTRDPTSDDGQSPDNNNARKKALDFYKDSKHYLEAGLHNVLAAQIMSHPVITIHPTTSIKETWDLFLIKRFRHIPVLSQEDKLVGIVSDRDILKLGIHLQSADDGQGKEKPVEKIMGKNVLFAKPDAEIRKIVYILIQKKIGAMPIINDLGLLLGIITRSDILKHFVSTSPLNLSV